MKGDIISRYPKERSTKMGRIIAVSYTHRDGDKRQGYGREQLPRRNLCRVEGS